MPLSTSSSGPRTASSSRTPKLSDDRIISLVDYGIGVSVGFSESKLSKERERVLRYYNGELPRKQHEGDSGYMSLDVFDGVEDMKAQLLDVFTANKRPVVFDPQNGEDPEAAKVRTDYVSNVLFNQNNGYKLFEDVIDKGLLERNGITKVWWEPRVKYEYVELSETSLDELQAFLAQHADEDPEPTEVDLHEPLEGGIQAIKRVRLRLTKDTSQVRIKAIEPENFGISPMAEDIETADLVWDRKQMTHSELLKAGYDKKLVDDLQDNDRLWEVMQPEKIARFHDTDDLIGTRVNEGTQEARRVCLVYECYLELDMDDGGDGDSDQLTQLFKITKVGNTILDKEPVERKPYLSFCPLPRPNAFWGTNYAKLLIPTQNARTYLTRSIINHAMITNNPRLLVAKGTLLSPKELMENRFGGLVNVRSVDGVAPLQQAGLNPFVFQTIQMLKDNKEELTSISGLAQGLNKDAISTQNSGDMIHELITVSQLRQKIVARNFAENYLGPLYNVIYRLVLENEDRQKIVQLSGQWHTVDFSLWPEECQVSVSFSLGYGEQQAEVAKWIGINKELSADPGLAGQYTQQNKDYVVRKSLEAAGILNTTQVLGPPQPPPPNPMVQAEIAMKQADAAVKNAQAQQMQQTLQLEMEKVRSAERIAMAKLQLEAQKIGGELKVKQDTLAHNVTVDAAEIVLQQQAQAQDKLTAEAMPK